ncbi:hypothetical protein N8703_03705 [Verrucomicrobia bacterium]|nr:hypothetical protein [Verrucomicrobiota bacterium]
MSCSEDKPSEQNKDQEVQRIQSQPLSSDDPMKELEVAYFKALTDSESTKGLEAIAKSLATSLRFKSGMGDD